MKPEERFRPAPRKAGMMTGIWPKRAGEDTHDLSEERFRPDVRSHLAWLMWCYQQGYTNPLDREGMTNWLLDDPATLHPDDAALRPRLLAMADEILAAL